MELKHPFTIIIYGPTAVGKSSFAETLAEKIPSEIVNLDIGQFYTPLTIGTAKPDWRSSKIIHHLFDCIDEPMHFTVVQYRKKILMLLQDIWQRNKIPILVGGSGFYLKSLFFPPQKSPAIKKSNAYMFIPDNKLWDHLHMVDSARAESIEKNDIYRVKRALDIWYTTGKKPSEFVPEYEPLSPFLLLFLTRDREELYGRINQRVIQMFDQGWVNEVEELLDTDWEPFLKNKKIIGYREIIEYLRFKKTEQDLRYTISTIQKKTRNYAKRQETFWRMLQKLLESALKKFPDKKSIIPSKIDVINLTFNEPQLYIKQLLKELTPLFK